jgi:TPR repeat protein
MYCDGLGVEQDIDQAEIWFGKAAEQERIDFEEETKANKIDG